MRRLLLATLGPLLGLILLGCLPASGAVCEPVDQSTENVLPGVILTFDSSFLCEDASDAGSYQITVRVTNAASSAEAVTIERLDLAGTSPSPRGQSPDATATASGLPVTLAPGDSTDFAVSGSYELVRTDEGEKANLHLRAHGRGVESALPFQLGINVHLRAPGVAAE